MIDDLALGYQHGTVWDRPSASTIRVRARHSYRPGVIPLFSEDGTLVASEVDAATGLTCDLAGSAGLGALISGSETASTGYDCRLVAKAGGVDRGLVFGVRGAGLTYAALASALGSSYVMKSPVVSFASNTQGGSNLDIADFVQHGGHYRYLESLSSLLIATQFIGTSATALDWSAFVADENVEIILSVYLKNNAATARDWELYADSGAGTLLDSQTNLANTQGEVQELRVPVTVVEHATSSTSAYHLWSSAPASGEGASIAVPQFWLPGEQ